MATGLLATVFSTFRGTDIPIIAFNHLIGDCAKIMGLPLTVYVHLMIRKREVSRLSV